MSGSEGQSRCASSTGRMSRRVNPETLLDEVQEHLRSAAGRTEIPDLSIEPRPLRLGQVSAAAAALLTKDPHAPQSPGVEITAHHSIQRDTGMPRLREGGSPLRESRPLAHDSAPPTRARKPSMAWVGGLLTIVLPPFFYLVLEMPISSFWDRQVDDHTFELASSSARPMNDPPAQRTAEPRLFAQGSQGMTGEPVPLRLTLLGRADDGVVTIAGLIPGMSLSSGRAIGADAWELPTTDLANAWVGPPVDFVGKVKLIAELHLADATIAHRQSIDFEWIATVAASPEQVPIATAPVDPEPVPIAAAPAGSDPVPITAGLAGLEQVSPVEIPPEAVTAPPPFDRDEIATAASDSPPAINEQHAASSHDNRAASHQRTAPNRKPFNPDRQHDARQATHSKWQIIRHCWSVGQLVGESSTSTNPCFRSLDISPGLRASL
jgi:hypothetical protein